MLKSATDPQPIVLSVQLYRLLVSAYPAGFRREYGEPMVQAFRDSARQANQEGGGVALLALWGRILVDTFKTVVEEYVHGGVHMTRDKFIRLAGWALLLGSFLIFAGWLAETRPQYDPYNFRSLPIDHYANLAALPLVGLGMSLISLGMLGMLVRYGRAAGSLGRFSLGFGALCGLVSAVGVIGLAVYDSNPWWSMFFLGWGLQSLFLALFGVASLQRQVLPRWNSLPLLTGIWIPAYMFISLLYEQATGSWMDVPEAVFWALFLVLLVGMSGLGYLLQSSVNEGAVSPGAV
jgi:hypothetical protein